MSKELQELLGPGSDGLRSKQQRHFVENIRRYNVAMAFCSFSDAADTPSGYLSGRGPPVYVLHGQAYHSLSTLIPSNADTERYGQLYAFDPDEASERRISWDAGLDKKILHKLHCMLLHLDDAGNLNPYAIAYKHLWEKMQEQQQAGVQPKVALRFRSGSTPDPRRYSLPTCRDIAVVFTGLHAPSKRDATVYLRSTVGCGDTHNVSSLNEHVDPLTYPLLFPYGEKGWCPELQVHNWRCRRRENIEINGL